MIRILVLLSLLTFSDTVKNNHWGTGIKTETVRDWELVYIDSSGICVSYFDEMSLYHEEKCTGIWENKTQYKLTWKTNRTIILEKGNLTALKYYRK